MMVKLHVVRVDVKCVNTFLRYSEDFHATSESRELLLAFSLAGRLLLAGWLAYPMVNETTKANTTLTLI